MFMLSIGRCWPLSFTEYSGATCWSLPLVHPGANSSDPFSIAGFTLCVHVAGPVGQIDSIFEIYPAHPLMMLRMRPTEECKINIEI